MSLYVRVPYLQWGDAGGAGNIAVMVSSMCMCVHQHLQSCTILCMATVLQESC